MATTDLKQRYENNKRRETNSATMNLPSLLGEAYRGTAKEVVLTATEYFVGKLPANIMVTAVKYLVTEAYTNATSAVGSVELGTTVLDAAVNLKVVGASLGTLAAPAYLTAETTVSVTPTFVGAATNDEAGIFKVIIEYNDFDRDTGSYIA